MTLSLNKFANISKIAGMTNEKMMKPHYEIAYKRVQQQSGTPVMTMETFFSALESIASNMNPEEKDSKARVKTLIDYLINAI